MYNTGFSYKKATQALNYLARKSGSTIDKLKVLKLIFFADKFHLRKYGRTITNDEYYAMQRGPVASGTKDILELSSFLDDYVKAYVINYLLPISNSLNVKSILDVDFDELSETDIEALNYIWEKVGSMNPDELCEFTHKFPAWKKFEARFAKREATRIKMDLDDFFDDPDEDIENFFELSEEEKKGKLDYLKELKYLESLWN